MTEVATVYETVPIILLLRGRREREKGRKDAEFFVPSPLQFCGILFLLLLHKEKFVLHASSQFYLAMESVDRGAKRKI